MSGGVGAVGQGVTWRYEAADAHGTTTRGEIEAASAGEAADLLRRRALWVIELEPANSGATAARATPLAFAGLRQRVARRTTGGDAALAMLTRSIATLLAAGVPLERALAFAAAGETDPRWRDIFGGLQEAVRGGASLSDAASRVAALPRTYAPLLAAAEASGRMADTFARLADDLEQRSQLQARVRAALVYPTVLALAATVGTAVILVVVVPRFADLIADAGGAVPASTRALIAASALLSRFGWLLAGAVVLVVASLRQWLQEPSRRRAFHAARLRWPLVGRLEGQHAAAGYLSTLAIALEAGVPLLRAMTVARGTVGNDAIVVQLERAEEVVRDGGSVAQALSGALPPLATRLLEAGEQGGALAPLAHRAATAAHDQVQRVITGAVALIEPVMILGFGGVVAFVALALLQAIYGINAGSFS